MRNFSGQILITAGDISENVGYDEYGNYIWGHCGLAHFGFTSASKFKQSQYAAYGERSGCKYYSTAKYYTSPIAAVRTYTVTGDRCGQWGVNMTEGTEGSFTVTTTATQNGCGGSITIVETYVGDGIDSQDGSALYTIASRTINGSLNCGEGLGIYTIINNGPDPNQGWSWQNSINPYDTGPAEAHYNVVQDPPTDDDRTDYYNEIVPYVTCCEENNYPSYNSTNVSACQEVGGLAYAYNLDLNNGFKSNRQSKFKITHSPSPTCYLKVYLRKKITHYTYTSGNEANNCASYWGDPISGSYETIGTYIWDRRSGNCIHPYLYENDMPIITGSTEYEIIADLGTRVEVESKYSLHEDYEPPDSDFK